MNKSLGQGKERIEQNRSEPPFLLFYDETKRIRHVMVTMDTILTILSRFTSARPVRSMHIMPIRYICNKDEKV